MVRKHFFIFWSMLCFFCGMLAASQEEDARDQRPQTALGGLAVLASAAAGQLEQSIKKQDEDSRPRDVKGTGHEEDIDALLHDASEAARCMLKRDNTRARDEDQADSTPRKRARVVKREVQQAPQAPREVDQIQDSEIFLDRLNQAIHAKSVDQVKKVLEQGAHIISSNGAVLDTPLRAAVKSRCLGITELLLQAGADVNNKSFVKSLGDSVFSRNTDVGLLNLLLDYGLDPQSNFGTWHPYAVAADQDNLGLIYYLFDHGFSLDTHSNIKTAACFAAERGDDEMLRFILEKNNDLAEQSIQGHGPLHYAASNGHLNCAQILIEEYNVRVNDVSSLLRYTPLMLATKSGHTHMVRYLLSKGARIDLKSKGNRLDDNHSRGKTALQFAEDAGHVEIASILKEAQRAILPPAHPAIALAGCGLPKADHSEFSQPVTSHDELRCSPSHAFSKEADELFEAVVASFSPKNKAKSTSALNPGKKGNEHQAVRAGAQDACPASARSRSESAEKRAQLASEEAGREASPTLLDADISEAAEIGDIEKIQSYLEKNPRAIAAKDENGMNLLHMLAHQGHFNEFLIVEVQSRSGQVHERTLKDATVLHYAAMSGNAELVSYLIDKGLSIADKTHGGMTPFMCAVILGHKEIVQLMLEKMRNSGKDTRAIVNQPTHKGQVPLIAAAGRGYAEIVCLLIDNGAIVDSYNRAGQTALAVAIEKSFTGDAGTNARVISILRSAGASLDQKMANGQTIAEFAKGHQQKNQAVLIVLGL